MLGTNLETWSWIAGIAGTLVTALAFLHSLLAGGRWKSADIKGKWDADAAKSLCVTKLKRHRWPRGLFGPFDSWFRRLQHEYLCEFALVYETRHTNVLVFLTKPRNFECHACAPYLNFFEFEKDNRGWTLFSAEYAAVQSGAWGTFMKDNLSIRVIGKNLYGVFLSYFGMGHGDSVSGVQIFSRIGDSFRELVDIRLSRFLHIRSNDADCLEDDGVGWDAKFSLRPSDTGLYDIVVEREGNGEDGLSRWNGYIREQHKNNYDPEMVTSRDVYRFDGAKYVVTDP